MKYLLCIICLMTIYCSLSWAHEQETVVVVPLIKKVEVKSKITVGEAKTLIDPGYAFVDRATMHARCVEHQTALLESCSGAGEAACIVKYNARLDLCDEIEEDQAEYQEALGILPCNGTVTTTKCTVGSPCALGGDRNGDNVPDSCNDGERCAAATEGTVCDPGTLYDCYSVTTFYPSTILNSFDRCECNCE